MGFKTHALHSVESIMLSGLTFGVMACGLTFGAFGGTYKSRPDRPYQSISFSAHITPDV